MTIRYALAVRLAVIASPLGEIDGDEAVVHAEQAVSIAIESDDVSEMSTPGAACECTARVGMFG